MKLRTLLTIAILVAGGLPLRGADEFGPNPTWKPSSQPEVREQVLAWLKTSQLEPAEQDKIKAQWPAENDAATAAELLVRLANSFAAADKRASQLVEFCSRENTAVELPDFAWLLDDKTPPFLRNNLRLYYARWLAQQDLYDESLVFLTGLEPNEVIDPASLLFYQSVGYHRLVQGKESREAANRLLEREEELPRRYQQLARLISDDLKSLEVDSLDHIARRMDDIRRRLNLGRAGKKVRDIEDGVIASLDKMIEEIEKQQQQQQQSASSGSQGQQSGQPMQDSQIAQQKGPGEVDRKNIGSRAGWGSLPPKEREAALQQVGKQFPAHFRDAIEQYFRKLASEETGPR
jgi:hypothetical protein